MYKNFQKKVKKTNCFRFCKKKIFFKSFQVEETRKMTIEVIATFTNIDSVHQLTNAAVDKTVKNLNNINKLLFEVFIDMLEYIFGSVVSTFYLHCFYHKVLLNVYFYLNNKTHK